VVDGLCVKISVVSPRKILYSVSRSLEKEIDMAESVYKVIELVGTSTESWERAAAAAVERASQSLRDLRIAEVVQLDMQLEEGKIVAYRAKVKVSFKYESSE
jgi:flavin-binding protein dodecin